MSVAVGMLPTQPPDQRLGLIARHATSVLADRGLPARHATKITRLRFPGGG
jgi:hypothetical protein